MTTHTANTGRVLRNSRGRPVSRSTYEILDIPLFCVLTRIQLRHWWLLPLAAWSHRKIWQQVKNLEHLKRCSFLLEDPRTFVILSIWDDEEAYVAFMTRATHHLQAARLTFAAVRYRGAKPEVWSTEWRIRATSRNVAWGNPADWCAIHEQLDGAGDAVTIPGEEARDVNHAS